MKKNTIVKTVEELATADYSAKTTALRSNGATVKMTVLNGITYVVVNGSVGVSKCDPEDEFSVAVGRVIALYRALKTAVPVEYIKGAHTVATAPVLVATISVAPAVTSLAISIEEIDKVISEFDHDEYDLAEAIIDLRDGLAGSVDSNTDAHDVCDEFDDDEEAMAKAIILLRRFGTPVADLDAPVSGIVTLAKADFDAKLKVLADQGRGVRCAVVANTTYVWVNGSKFDGVSTCHENDVFNSDIGKVIALYRAMGLPVPIEYTSHGLKVVSEEDPCAGCDEYDRCHPDENPIYDGRCIECGKDAGDCVHTIDCDEVLESIITEHDNDMVSMAKTIRELRG